MIDANTIIRIEPTFRTIEEAQIHNGREFIGWHSTCFDGNQKPLGSGCGTTRIAARRIGVAETLERAVFKKTLNSTRKHQLLLDSYPSTCGFAAGFDSSSVRFRSLCEAVERWALEKWIDEDCPFKKMERSSLKLSPLAQFFSDLFSEVTYFSERFAIPYGGQLLELTGAVVVATTEQGAFLGSRVTTRADDLWTHPLTEAWRHKLIFEKVRGTPFSELSDVRQKIKFFGLNKEAVLLQVMNSKTSVWSMPRLRLAEEIETDLPGVYVWRHMFDGFRGWDKGPIERFLY